MKSLSSSDVLTHVLGEILDGVSMGVGSLTGASLGLLAGVSLRLMTGVSMGLLNGISTGE